MQGVYTIRRGLYSLVVAGEPAPRDGKDACPRRYSRRPLVVRAYRWCFVDRRGILYAPDYAANAGGLMNSSIELEGYDRERAIRMTRTIYYNVGKIFDIAERDGIPTWKAADRMAEERVAAVSRLQIPFLGRKPLRFRGRTEIA